MCTGTARPTAPITIGDQELAQYTRGQQCSSQGHTLTTTPNVTQNSCWLTNPSGADAWFPKVSGCGTGTARVLSVGDSLDSITNGDQPPLYRDFQNCVDVGVHDFIIPIVPSPIANCNAGTSLGRVVGFATIHIASSTDIHANGSGGSSLTFTQVCNNNTPGTGGGSGGATCFGSGNARLVDDRSGA